MPKTSKLKPMIQTCERLQAIEANRDLHAEIQSIAEYLQTEFETRSIRAKGNGGGAKPLENPTPKQLKRREYNERQKAKLKAS